MCILCKVAHGENYYSNTEKASKFLTDFEQASYAIKKASESMLECSAMPLRDEDKRRYNATHKKMVKLLREWNSLEHFRENAVLTNQKPTTVLEL